MHKEWAKLRAKIIEGSELRNALAHFHSSIHVHVGQSVELQVRFLSNDGEFIGETKTKDKTVHKGVMMLHPNSSDPNEKFKKDHRQKTKKPMNVEDIVRLRGKFQNLSDAIKTFSRKILQQEAPSE